MMAAATAARFAMRHRMPTIKSVDAGKCISQLHLAHSHTVILLLKLRSLFLDNKTTAVETGRDTEVTDTGKLSEEREILMKDLDTRIVVQVTHIRYLRYYHHSISGYFRTSTHA